MTWLESFSACISKCCGHSDKEYDGLASDPRSSFQPTYTVRRISSFGQTITDEKGEEKEIGRHTSVVTYDGNSAPWSSKPAPVQPGVTVSDVRRQVEKMPPITEYPTKNKSKQRWKKNAISSKKEIIFSDLRKVKHEVPQNIQLKGIKFFGEQGLETHEVKKPDLSSTSHENLFSKCSRKTSNEGDSPGNFLGVPGLLMKSISTPDLVDGEILNKKKKETIKALGQSSIFTDKKLLIQPSTTDKNSKDLIADKLAREYGLDLALYTEEALNESIKSVLQTNAPSWLEEPVGTLVLSIDFNTLQKMLNITLISFAALSGSGLENESFSTIIKLSLIGSKKYSKTSKRIEEEWINDINQYFSFLIKDMDFRSLRISVYNADWLGKHDAVAYGLLSLQHLLDKSENIHLKLYSQPNFGSDIGMMQIYFGYDGIMFTVRVEKIFNYDLKIRNWKMYTKIAFYSLSKKVKERASNLVWNEISGSSSELCFNHSASFRVEPSGKKHSYIVVTLKRGDSHGVFKSDQSLGRVILGPSYYYQDGKQLTPWGLAITTKMDYCYAFKMYG